MAQSPQLDAVQAVEAMLANVPEAIRSMSAYKVPKHEGITAKLDANEYPFSLPPDLAQALSQHLSSVALNRYPDPAATELRSALAKRLAIPEQSLVFGNGSDELIQLLLCTFAKAKDGQSQARVLYPSPSFSVFRIFANAMGVETIEVPLQDDFSLNEDETRQALRAGSPNIAFFARPNNPTGTLWSGQALLRFCHEFPSTLFISDEAYDAYAGASLLQALPKHPNLAVMRTISKLGFAGLRFGYLCAHPSLCNEIEKVRGPYNVGSLNQAAALWLLNEHPELLSECRDRVLSERTRVDQGLRAHRGIRVFDSAANLILFRVETNEGATMDAQELWHALVKKRVLIRNLDKPGPLQGCLRVSVGRPEENTLFLDSMRELLA